jgi:hypothetical protein
MGLSRRKFTRGFKEVTVRRLELGRLHADPGMRSGWRDIAACGSTGEQR